MKYISCITIATFLLWGNLSAQHYTYPNFTYQDSGIKSIENLLTRYLKNPQQSDSLWSAYDRATYKSIDVLKNAQGLDGSLYDIVFDANILSVTPVGNDYIAKVIFYWNEKDTTTNSNRINVLGIANYLVVMENGSYRLSNYINYAARKWISKTVGKFNYIYHPQHPFDFYKAQQANTFAGKIEEWFDISPTDTFTCFIAANCSGIARLAGFDYFIGEGGNDLNLCGFFDQQNNIIYSNTIAGENYEHEIIHIINKKYSEGPVILKMGLSAYINNAGSKNKGLDFHVTRYMEYALKNKVDLAQYKSINYYDEITNPGYVFGGLICNAIIRKGGLSLLKKALATNDLHKFLEQELKVKDYTQFFSTEYELFIKQKGPLLNTR